jgi:putative FmdB family regulatory protein
MPIYQYLCPKCNLKFELKQSFSAESMVACPKCQNGAQRCISAVPVIFKGSGFYVTDNRKSSPESTSSENKVDKKENKKEDKKEDKGPQKETQP